MEVTVEGSRVKLAGCLDECAPIESIQEALVAAKSSPKKPVRIDFSNLRKANSVGLRLWIDLIQELDIEGSYEKVPEWFVDHFNFVEELSNEGKILVTSLIAPFVDSKSGRSSNKLLIVGTDLPILDSYDTFAFDSALGELRPDFDPGDLFEFIGKMRSEYERRGLCKS